MKDSLWIRDNHSTTQSVIRSHSRRMLSATGGAVPAEFEGLTVPPLIRMYELSSSSGV
jgi:hypothetical protein